MEKIVQRSRLQRITLRPTFALVFWSTLFVALNTNFADKTRAANLPDGQELLPLKIEVLDEKGNPVPNAKVTPVALRSSNGHSRWKNDDERSGVGPRSVNTSASGIATILFPRVRNLKLKLATRAVSVQVDHPDYAVVDQTSFKLNNGKPKNTIELVRGGHVEVQPLMDGKPANLDGLHALWSDSRSWIPGANPEKTKDGTLRIPTMAPGKNSLLLVRLDGALTTQFSKIIHFEIEADKTVKLKVPLEYARQIDGILSPEVPRPVRNGRVKLNSYSHDNEDLSQVEWKTWVPVRADGTFSIPGWPVGERLQVIAMCDGFIAESGEPPETPKVPPADPDPFLRPQVFPPAVNSINIKMTEMSTCAVTTIDTDKKPIEGLPVASYPNVGWWGNGAQVYCGSLIRGEQLLRVRDYHESVDDQYPFPFEAITDAEGKATLTLPIGRHRLWMEHETYKLPAILEKQMTEPVEIVAGETTEVTLVLKKVLTPTGENQ